MQSIPLHKAAELRIAVEVCLTFEGKVLLQKRSEEASVFPGYWTLPGGHVDLGEDLAFAAAREVREETGVKIAAEKLSLKAHSINHHIDREQIWIAAAFVGELSEFQECKSSSEGICEWFELDEIVKMEIFPPIKLFFEKHFQADGTVYSSGRWEKGELLEITHSTKTK